MAAAPRAPLTAAERQSLKKQIAERAAAKAKSDSDAQVAKDKAKYNPTKGRVIAGTPEYVPHKVRAGRTTVRTKTKVPTTVVQGATTTEAQRANARKSLEARRAARASRASTPQAEKPKNTNYKPKPKLVGQSKQYRNDDPASQKKTREAAKARSIAQDKKDAAAKDAPKSTHYADALAAIRKEYADKAADADKRKNPPAKENVQKVKSPAASKNLAEAMDKRDAKDKENVAARRSKDKAANSAITQRLRDKARARGDAAPAGSLSTQKAPGKKKSSTVDGKPWKGTNPGGQLDKRGPVEGVHYPKGGKRPTQEEWQKYRDTTRGRIKTNSQPGTGAPTGGTGRDADGGKGRTSFEDRRREGMAGQAKDRPPVYKPQDDGQRGGYINRSSKGPAKPIPPYVRPSDKPTGKIPARGNTGTIRTDVRTIPAPAKKKLPPIGGSSVVKGLTPR